MEATINRTEVSKNHFLDEGERIKAEDRKAVYEIREPKELAMRVDFGFARYDILFNLVDKYAKSLTGLIHLDLGCGLGYVMAKMAERKYKSSGVDISRSFLDITEEKLKHYKLPFDKLIEADIQKYIDLPDNYFDIITSTDVIEHIENQDIFFKQLYRLLKPGGKAFISTNNGLSVWGVEKYINEIILQKQCFHPIDKWPSFFSFKKTLRKHGFKIVEIRGTYFFPLSRFRLLLSLFGLYKWRYEINEWFSGSFAKCFGRDVILVIEK